MRELVAGAAVPQPAGPGRGGGVGPGRGRRSLLVLPECGGVDSGQRRPGPPGGGLPHG
jgi:hypothetical protein